VFTSAYRKIRDWTATANGATVVPWDLKDGSGKPMAAGLYYVVLAPEGGERQVRSVVVLK
jgi:hypothetical protein